MPKVINNPKNKVDILSPGKFGSELLHMGDLDPVYPLVYYSDLSRNETKLKRWLLAYWCFYHVGTANWIVDHYRNFWGRMREAAASKEFLRCSERRHFRGQNAITSVEWLFNQGGVNKLFEPIWGKNLGAEEVIDYVKTWKGFGPWIAFKVADMLERIRASNVEFTSNLVLMYDSPREGAIESHKYYSGVHQSMLTEEAQVLRGYSKLTSDPELYFWVRTSQTPPLNDRPIGVQEFETILCKWNSYRKGKYHLGEDIESVKQCLSKGIACKTNDAMQDTYDHLVQRRVYCPTYDN